MMNGMVLPKAVLPIVVVLLLARRSRLKLRLIILVAELRLPILRKLQFQL